jgi:hypothetical protein
MVRNISGFGQYNLTDNAFSSHDWQLNITNRYFKAWRDFKGTVDQKTMADSQSIIRSLTMDFTLTKLIKNGWSISLSMPVSANSRNSVKDHDSIQRHTTRSFGVGDIRFTVYKWLFKPSVSQKLNVQLGLGIKLPSGDYKYEDYHYRKDGSRILAPVNASIALGDGGTGIVTEVNAFYIASHRINVYANLFYLINPRDQNGVSTTNGDTPNPLVKIAGGDVFSVPDVYSLRTGVNFNLPKMSFSAGLRHEGVPVHDLIGNSNGRRRPGYNLSFEPGTIFKMKKTSFYVYVPIIMARTIKQDVPDANLTKLVGEYKRGTGASGNYYLFAGVLFKL